MQLVESQWVISPICSSWRARGNIIPENTKASIFIVCMKRNISFIFITHFIFCWFSSFIYYCKWKDHRCMQKLVAFHEVLLGRSNAATAAFPEVQTSSLSSGQSLKVSARHVCTSHGWCKWVPLPFPVILKNNVQPQKFNEIIAGVQWRNIASTFILIVLVKLSGVKLSREDLKTILGWYWASMATRTDVNRTAPFSSSWCRQALVSWVRTEANR